MMSDEGPTCDLCSLPVADARVSDGELTFCCAGCHRVYSVLGEQELEVSGDRLGEADSRGVEPPEGYDTIFLNIDGMHCSTCEVYIELVAGRHDAVGAVEASYVSDTVKIAYDPDLIDEPELLELVSGMGYRAFRRDDVEARERAHERTTLRLGAGVVAGAFVMFVYMMLIYPTYFGDRIYGEQATEMLIEGLYHGAAGYLFVAIGLLTSVVLFYTGWPILRGAYVSIRARSPNMDLLITIAAMSAFAYSWLEIYVGGTHIYFDVSVAIILVVTLGGEYEAHIKGKAMERLSDLQRIQIDEAVRYDDGTTTTVSIDDVVPGDRLLVREGERVPVDGTVVDGHGTVDESVITGESLPISKRLDDRVVGGSVVRSGSIVITVGDDVQSSLDRITHLLWNLQSSNHGIQKLADRLATIFVPLVMIVATVVTVVYLGWLGADIAAALLVGLTVLIVSCPCALGLATPLAVAAGVRDALAHGIVVFDDTVFERLRGVDIVIFDKTGTLTTGDMSVLDTAGPQELLERAAALEGRSAHPIAKAISESLGERAQLDTQVQPDGGVAEERGEEVRQPRVTNYESFGNGVGGEVEGDELLVGHPDLFDSREWTIPTELRDRAGSERRSGHIPVIVGQNGRAAGMIVVGDQPRADWDQTISTLADRGVSVVVLTGDEAEATTIYREHPGIEHVFAGVPPEGKAEVVQRLRADGSTVMVGDGTNDAPALAGADLGIALGGGTAVAADAADLAIVDDDLATVATAFDLSASAGRRVKQNIGWAFVYNGIAIPLAITGLLNPLFAALAMGTSSLLVVSNSTRKLD